MRLHFAVLVSSLCIATLPAQMSGSYLVQPGGSAGTFQTFTEAVNAMFVGGISGPCEIFVAPGAYNESVLVPPITGASATNTITFRSLSGPGTVLLTGAAGDTFALVGVAFLHNRSITWDGIDFLGAPGHAISATTFVEDLEIRNCYFAAGHRSTAAGEYRHAVIVSENSGAEIGWRVHHNRITLSTHTNKTSYGIYLSNGGGWDIHHNAIDLNGGDHGLWLINNNNRLDRIFDNLFFGPLNPVSGAYANSVTGIRCDISNYNNEITHNTFAVILPTGGSCIATGGYGSGSTASQNYLYGNVFATIGGTAICVGASGTTAQPFESNGNVFYCPGGELGRIGANGTGATSIAAWQVLSGKDITSIETDPLLQAPFVTPPDLRPLPTSPVVGVAQNTPSYVTTDFAGRLRDAQPDAGAYESTSFVLYGQGCPGTGSLVPAMGGSGPVAQGSATFAFELAQAPPAAIAVLFGGESKLVWAGVPLPLDIGGGCSILASVDASLVFPTGPAGTVTAPFAIPSSPLLSGVDWFFQWAILDANGGSPFGITVSAGAVLQL